MLSITFLEAKKENGSIPILNKAYNSTLFGNGEWQRKSVCQTEMLPKKTKMHLNCDVLIRPQKDANNN